MFSARCLGVLVVGWSFVWSAQAEQRVFDVPADVTARAMAHHLDQIQSGLRAQLELVAATPAAQRGSWEEIKPYLTHISNAVSAGLFYMLPNGDYYAVDRDFTHLNLGDRPYFQKLMSGVSVDGFPLYSRSTGKKSAFFAVPIVVGDRVTGAIGASLYLDELHRHIGENLQLPPNFTWFVVNAEGNTMLDKDAGFIFMNALTQGSPSLKRAMEKVLRGESGRIEYELGGVTRRAVFQKLPRLDWWLILAHVDAGKLQMPPEVSVSLEELKNAMQDRLDAMDAGLAEAVAEWDGITPDPQAIRATLATLAETQPWAVNAGFITPDGILQMLEPPEYKNFENVDISDQAQVTIMRDTQAPVFSSSFIAAEGGLAVDIARPVFEADGQFIGSISLLIYPDVWTRQVLQGVALPDGAEVWSMQPDGMILYDQDEDEIGRMLFSDPLYAEFDGLLQVGRRIAAEPSGKGDYTFMVPGHQDRAFKMVEWDTVTLHHRSWRIVLGHRPYDRDQEQTE